MHDFFRNDHQDCLGNERLNHTVRLFTLEYIIENFPFQMRPYGAGDLVSNDRRNAGLAGSLRSKGFVTRLVVLVL